MLNNLLCIDQLFNKSIRSCARYKLFTSKRCSRFSVISNHSRHSHCHIKKVKHSPRVFSNFSISKKTTASSMTTSSPKINEGEDGVMKAPAPALMHARHSPVGLASVQELGPNFTCPATETFLDSHATQQHRTTSSTVVARNFYQALSSPLSLLHSTTANILRSPSSLISSNTSTLVKMTDLEEDNKESWELQESPDSSYLLSGITRPRSASDGQPAVPSPTSNPPTNLMELSKSLPSISPKHSLPSTLFTPTLSEVRLTSFTAGASKRRYHYPSKSLATSPTFSPSRTSSSSSGSSKRTNSLNLSRSATSPAPVANKFFQKFMITIIKVNHNLELNQPYVKLTFGDKVFQTSSLPLTGNGMWNEGFEFMVSYHYQLFGTCQLDLYEATWFLPDTHRGRAEIRLANLQGFPAKFTSYYELYDKRYSSSTISELARRTVHMQNLGAIQVRVQYKFMDPADWHVTQLEEEEGRVITRAESPPPIDESDMELMRSPLRPITRCPKPDDQFFKIDNLCTSPTSSKNSLSPTRRPTLLAADPSGYLEQEQENEDDDSMFHFVGSYLLSKQTRAVLRGVTRVYLAFFQGMEVRHVEFFSGILLLEKYFLYAKEQKLLSQTGKKENTNEEELDDVALTNFHMGREACQLHKYALAVYGWRGLVFCGKLTPGHTFTDHRAVMAYLKLTEDELLGYEFHSNMVFQPTYFIALDKESQALVLSIRGTMSVLDALTDLVCDYLPWRGGLVHSGILTMAQSLMRHVIPGLMSHAVQHNVSKLYIVGHSLGGGAASLLTMMLLDHLHEFRLPSTKDNQTLAITCYAYGPPPSVSHNLANHPNYKPHIHSIVNGDDLVPHLSYGAMMDFKHLVLAATEAANMDRQGGAAGAGAGGFLSIARWAASAFQSDEATRDLRERRFDKLDDARKHLKEVSHLNPKLYLPGKVHHINTSNQLPEPFTYNRTVTRLNKSSEQLSAAPAAEPMSKTLTQETLKPPYKYLVTGNADEFLEVRVHASMLLDHMPSQYDVSLTQCNELIDRLLP